MSRQFGDIVLDCPFGDWGSFRMQQTDNVKTEQACNLDKCETIQPKARRVVLAHATCFIMVMTWLISLVTPFYLCKIIFFGDIQDSKLAATILTIAMVSFAPWPCSQDLRAVFASGGIEYFKHCSILYEEKFVDPSKPAKLMAVHPHGLIAMGWGLLFNRPELDLVQFVFSKQLYYNPVFHLFTRLIGHPNSCEKKSFIQLMRSQVPMALIPGGFEEATIHSDNSSRVFIKHRLGFVKYALKFGYALVPCYCFGENKTFTNCSPWGIPFGLWLNSWGCVGAVGCGRWWFFPFIPRNDYMHIVVGKAVQLPQIDNPTNDDVHKYHEKYVTALKDLFDRHKTQYGEYGELEVW